VAYNILIILIASRQLAQLFYETLPGGKGSKNATREDTSDTQVIAGQLPAVSAHGEMAPAVDPRAALFITPLEGSSCSAVVPSSRERQGSSTYKAVGDSNYSKVSLHWYTISKRRNARNSLVL
jgi:hypothetical protein